MTYKGMHACSMSFSSALAADGAGMRTFGIRAQQQMRSNALYKEAGPRGGKAMAAHAASQRMQAQLSQLLPPLLACAGFRHGSGVGAAAAAPAARAARAAARALAGSPALAAAPTPAPASAWAPAQSSGSSLGTDSAVTGSVLSLASLTRP